MSESEISECEGNDFYVPLSPPPLLLLRTLEEELIKSSVDVADLKARMARYRSLRGMPPGGREAGGGEGRMGMQFSNVLREGMVAVRQTGGDRIG